MRVFYFSSSGFLFLIFLVLVDVPVTDVTKQRFREPRRGMSSPAGLNNGVECKDSPQDTHSYAKALCPTQSAPETPLGDH